MPTFHTNTDSVNDFWFAPIKFINMKQEVVTNRGKVRHYHSTARCNIQILNLEQKRMVHGFQRKLRQSERIIAENDTVREKIERKRITTKIVQHDTEKEMIKVLRQQKPAVPPWKSDERAKSATDNLRHKKLLKERDSYPDIPRSRSRDSIRNTLNRFEDRAKTVSLSYPRIKEAWTINTEKVISPNYMKRYESKLTTEEKYSFKVL